MYEIIKCVFITLFGPLILKVIKTQLMEQRRKQTRIFSIQAQVDCQHLKKFFERVVVVRGVTVIWINGNVACVQNFCQPEHLHFCPEKAHKVFTELGQSDVSDRGLSHTFWSLRSRLRNQCAGILLGTVLGGFYQCSSTNPIFSYFKQKISNEGWYERCRKGIVTTYICLGGLGRKRSSTW